MSNRAVGYSANEERRRLASLQRRNAAVLQLAGKQSYALLAAKFGMSRSAVAAIVWRHKVRRKKLISSPGGANNMLGTGHHGNGRYAAVTKIKKRQSPRTKAILKMVGKQPYPSIARMFGVTPNVVASIVYRSKRRITPKQRVKHNRRMRAYREKHRAAIRIAARRDISMAEARLTLQKECP